MRSALSSVVNQAEKLLKAVELLNRDLRIFRKNCPVKKYAMLELLSSEEAATAEFLMKESHRRLVIAKYTANQNTVLVQTIQKSIPGTQLVPLSQSTTYYQSNGFATKLDQVKALTHSKGTTVRLVDVPRTSLFSLLPERYREGIVRIQAEWQVTHKGGVTKNGVTEIVIFDKNAEGIVRKELLMPRLEPPKRAEPEDIKALPAPPIDPVKLMVDMGKMTVDQVINLLQNKPADWILDEATVEKLQKLGLKELKAKGVTHVFVMRIQANPRPLPNKPAMFVGVPLSYIGVDNPVTAKLNIGYNDASAADFNGNKVWIWKEDINRLVDSDWDTIKDAFNTYYLWGKKYNKITGGTWAKGDNLKNLLKGLTDKDVEGRLKGFSDSELKKLSDFELEELSDFELGKLREFMETMEKYGFLDSKFEFIDKKGMEKIWDERISLTPRVNMFEDFKQEARTNGIEVDEHAQQNPKMGLGLILNEYFSVFDLYGGDRLGRRPDGHKGGGEWIVKLSKPGDFDETKLTELKKEPIETIFKK